MAYKVRHDIDNIYIVYEESMEYIDDEYKTEEDVYFKGNLSDCVAYIRLTEEGYM